MPKLTDDLFAVPDGELHPRWFRAGDDVTGSVAAAAEAQGKLEAEQPKQAPRRKAHRGAPENK